MFAAAALLSYATILRNTPVADDFGHLVSIQHMPVSGLWRLITFHSPIFIRPIPFLQIWVFYRLFGMDWFPSHVVNVLMHAGAALAIFWLLKKIGAAALAAFAAASLFLLTPIATEAVTWLGGRFDVWCLLFLILSLGVYVIAIQRGSWSAYSASIILALVALFSKEPAMMLVILFPALEILVGFYPSRLSEWKTVLGNANWRLAAYRLLIFFAIIVAFIAMRYAIMGRLGNYRNASYLGVPSLKNTARTGLTLLAPIDALEATGWAVELLRLYTGCLMALSIGMVVLRWRHGSTGARRAWLFSLIFFTASLLVIFQTAFVTGMNNYLGDSRYFYISMTGFYGMMAIGLLEFGWKKRSWQIGAVVAIAILLPVFVWGINRNNQAWRYAASINERITDETFKLLPDPPANSKIYFDYIPRDWGGHILANGAKEALLLRYNRTDLNIQYAYPLMVNPHGIPMPRIYNTDEGYLFAFDWKTQRVVMLHTPAGTRSKVKVAD